MRIESFYRSNSCPVCPVCSGRHHPATNGAGRRIHCDGSPAETAKEQRTRERATAKEQREREQRATDARKDKRRATDARRRKQRAHERTRLLIQAERATRPDAPTIDATIDGASLPDIW